MYFKNEKGFTLVELALVLMIIAVLAGIAIPSYLSMKDRSKESATKTEMASIAESLESYKSDSGHYPWSFGANVLSDYIKNYSTKDQWQRDYIYLTDSNFVNYSFTSYGIDGIQGTDDIVFRNGLMESGGKYDLGLSQTMSVSKDTTIVNTTVAATTTTMLTPLGNTFTEITTSMIELTQNFYDKTGKWPRSWAPYSFTDLGLNPADWQKANEHVYYSTGGSRVMVKPETGYILQFTDSKTGALKTLSYDTNWNLIYSMETGKWYYHTILPENEIMVADLKVIKS